MCKGLGRVLLDEDFPGALIQRLIGECQNVHFGKTNNRSVTGVMVDHVKSIKWSVSYTGGLRECDISKLTKRLNRTPLLTQKFSYSIDELGRVLGVKVNPKLS